MDCNMASEITFHTGSYDMDHAMSIVEGMKSSMIVSAACQLEIFDLLGKYGSDGCKASVITDENGWDPDNTKRLLDALAALKLVDKHDDVYNLAAAGGHFKKDHPESLFPYTTTVERFMHGLRAIPEEVKTGSKKSVEFPHHVVMHKSAPKTENNNQIGADQDKKKMPMLTRYKMYDGMASAHVAALATAFDLMPYKTVVDLGGGSGTLAFQLKKTYKDMNVTLYEVPIVIDLVKEHFLPGNEHLGVKLVSGDFFVNDIPDADLYILAKIVHDWNTEQTTTLLKKIAGKLKPGGALILMEKCLNTNKDGPITASVWDMLLLSHCAGRIRSGREYSELLSSVGFKDVKVAKSQDLCTYDVIYAIRQ